MIKHEVEKDDGKESKLAAGLAKVSREQLMTLYEAVRTEMEHRAKKAKAEKKPSEMGEREFETFVAREISKAAGKDNQND